jgi:hypothetical protein
MRIRDLARQLGLSESALRSPVDRDTSRSHRSEDVMVPFHTGIIDEGRDAGATGVFSAELGGRRLTFIRRDDAIVDDETGSTWSVIERATAGPLAGQQLEQIVHGDHFWFAWAASRPTPGSGLCRSRWSRRRSALQA